jgi:CheY-like chemotaxis protein
MQRRTILVVDDSDSIRDALACVLEIAGHVPVLAADGEEGVGMPLRHRPDAILLDIMMPVLDGWGAIRRLRADPETAGIPVLALTALRLSQAQVDEAGFDGYLSKPVPSHRLLEEIERACSRVRARA